MLYVSFCLFVWIGIDILFFLNFQRFHREPNLQVRYRGLLDALMQIRNQEGYAGFFRGVGPRLFVHAPSVAVSWTTFEVLKKTLDRMNNDDSE